MRDYGTARTVGKIVAAFGWVAAAIGIVLLLVAFGTMRSGFGLLALAPALGIIVGAALMIAQGQLLQAQVDVASNTAELVNLMRRAQAPQA